MNFENRIFSDFLSLCNFTRITVNFSFLFQLPPLTPGTNKKMGETLKFIYSYWGPHAEKYKIPKNPRVWNNTHVRIWLQWTVEEFQFGVSYDELINEFPLNGNEMCDLTREQFEKRTPGYVGDILHEHLAILQQDALDHEDQPVNFSMSYQLQQQQHAEQQHQLAAQQQADPYYSGYTPPAHLYPNFTAHQTHHLYAGEQYHGYGFQQPMVSIPPPPHHIPIYRHVSAISVLFFEKTNFCQTRTIFVSVISLLTTDTISNTLVICPT